MLTVPAKYRRYVWIGGGIIVLYIAFRIWANIPVYDSKKMGEYAALKSQTAKTEKELTAKNKILADSIAAKDKVLADKTATIARKDTILAGLGKKQADLEAEYATLKDCPSRLVNLSLQVTNLEDTIKVKDGIISDKDDMIFTLTAQKKDALMGWENTKKILDDYQKQAAACDAVQKQLQRDLKISKLVGRGKSALIIGAGAYLAYTLLKKKG